MVPSIRRVLSVTCNLLLPAWGLSLPASCSLTPLLQVIIVAFEEERVSSLFPFHSWIVRHPHPYQTLASFRRSSMLPSGYTQQTLPTPLRPYYTVAQLSGECRCFEASCIKLPLSGQRHRGTVGARLFWHSLYVLLIGANWHRGAPLFLCIIRPSSLRWEERA